MTLTKNNYKQFFANENFIKLNPAQREDLIRFSVETIRNDLGLDPVKLTFVDNGQAFGNTIWTAGSRGAIGLTRNANGAEHSMYLNSDSLTRNDDAISYETFKTINHELEHGVQNTQIRDKSISNDNTEVAELRANNTHYYKPSTGGFTNKDGKSVDRALYLSQVKEAKAREAGLNAVKTLVSENKANGIDDPKGEDYILDLSARENIIRKNNIQALGPHAREEMARESMNYMPNMTGAQKEAVIDQARNADLENMQKAYGKEYSAEQLKSKFENSNPEDNYFKSTQYTDKMSKIRSNQFIDGNKASDMERASYLQKFEPQSNDDLSTNANTEFLEKHDVNNSNDSMSNANEEYLNRFSEENTSSNSENNTQQATNTNSNTQSQSNDVPM